MKSFILIIKNILRKIADFFKINPHKHWAFLLYFFSVIVVLLIIFSLYLLYKIKNEQIFQVRVNNEIKETLLKESALNRVINTFDNKAIKEQIIIDSPSKYKDPNL